MGSESQDSVTVEQLRASKKVLVTGPIMKKTDMQNFKKFLNTEASKSGAVDRVEVEDLPETFLLPEMKGEGKVAVIASVLFKGATGSFFIEIHSFQKLCLPLNSFEFYTHLSVSWKKDSCLRGAFLSKV